jgi:hypothetical protein
LRYASRLYEGDEEQKRADEANSFHVANSPTPGKVVMRGKLGKNA